MDPKARWPAHLPRRRLLRIIARHDGTSFPTQRKRLAAPYQRAFGQTCTHKFGIAHWSAHARVHRGFVARHRHRFRHLHRRTYAHRGCALSEGVRHYGPSHHDAYRRPPWPPAYRALVEKCLGLFSASPDKGSALVSPLGLGARVHSSPLHAGGGGAHRDAMATPVVLAVLQNARQSRGQGADLHSEGERVRTKICGSGRRHCDEPASRDPVRYSWNGTLHRRLCDCGFTGTGRGGRAPPRFWLSKHVHLRRICSRGKSRCQSEPDYYRAGRARDESNSFRERDDVERLFHWHPLRRMRLTERLSPASFACEKRVTFVTDRRDSSCRPTPP